MNLSEDTKRDIKKLFKSFEGTSKFETFSEADFGLIADYWLNIIDTEIDRYYSLGYRHAITKTKVAISMLETGSINRRKGEEPERWLKLDDVLTIPIFKNE